MTRMLAPVPLLLLSVLPSPAVARADAAGHVMLTAAELKWGAPPPVLPPGAKLAVLSGDPSKAGALFIIRLQLPANYKVPAHWHPTDENITVISGTFFMGFGDKLDPARATALPTGGFSMTPAKTNHFAFTKKETVVEVAAMGPFVLTYVNPADDPTHKSAPAQK